MMVRLYSLILLALAVGRGANPAWHAAPAVSSLGFGQPLLLRVGGRRVYLVRRGPAVVALLAEDTTAGGGEIVWDATGRHFAATRTGSTFALDGRHIKGPAPRGLDYIGVRVVGDSVQINPELVALGAGRR